MPSTSALDLENKSLYTRIEAPGSGLPLWFLTRRAAPVQQSFYFVNDGLSADGRWLWFYGAFPPSGNMAQGRVLCVVDHEKGTVNACHETQFCHASPWVDPANAQVYWAQGPAIWKRGPNPDDKAILVNRIPDEVIGGRPVSYLSTHLTRTADGKAFFVDGKIGAQYVFGTLPSDGGAFTPWHRFDRCHNHAIACPTDPDAVLFAQEMHTDVQTGLTFPITDRLQFMRRGEGPRSILKEPRWVTHEWWDPDGKHAWCVVGKETWRVEISTGRVEVIPFPRHCWHSHSSRDGRLIIGDSCERFFRGTPSTVHFMNRSSGKTLVLVDNPGRPDHVGQNYHIDPHPRFIGGDQYVIFTSTLRGEVDVALAKVKDLLDRTA